MSMDMNMKTCGGHPASDGGPSASSDAPFASSHFFFPTWLGTLGFYVFPTWLGTLALYFFPTWLGTLALSPGWDLGFFCLSALRSHQVLPKNSIHQY